MLPSHVFRWLFQSLSMCFWMRVQPGVAQYALCRWRNIGAERGGKAGGALTRSSLGRRHLLQAGTGARSQQSRGAGGGGGGRESRNRLASVRRGVRKQVATQQRVLPRERVWGKDEKRQHEERAERENDFCEKGPFVSVYSLKAETILTWTPCPG